MRRAASTEDLLIPTGAIVAIITLALPTSALTTTVIALMCPVMLLVRQRLWSLVRSLLVPAYLGYLGGRPVEQLV